LDHLKVETNTVLKNLYPVLYLITDKIKNAPKKYKNPPKKYKKGLMGKVLSTMGNFFLFLGLFLFFWGYLCIIWGDFCIFWGKKRLGHFCIFFLVIFGEIFLIFWGKKSGGIFAFFGGRIKILFVFENSSGIQRKFSMKRKRSIIYGRCVAFPTQFWRNEPSK
jgi:hypothetical protein